MSPKAGVKKWLTVSDNALYQGLYTMGARVGVVTLG